MKVISNSFLRGLVNILVLGILTFTSCLTSEEVGLSLDDFFNQLDELIEPEEVKLFKNTPETSLHDYPDFSQEVFNLLLENKDLNSILEKDNIVESNHKIYILVILFHRFLNQKEYEYSKLVEEFNAYLDESRSYLKELKKCEEKRLSIAKANLEKINLGDTVYLSIPVDQINNIRYTFYYDCPTDYQELSDSLSLTGILLQKGKYSKGTWSDLNPQTSISFEIKILELSEVDTPILWRRYAHGSSIIVDLLLYGRLIRSASIRL